MEVEISGLVTLIDECDLYLLSLGEPAISTGEGFHNYVTIKFADGTFKRLHRLITNAPDDKVVDHINHNGLDNRRLNLKVCTHQENLRNSNKWRLKELPKGVSKSSKGYRARIQARKYETKFLGTFKTIEDAVKARTAAENKFWHETE